jgi:hypothetical protein
MYYSLAVNKKYTSTQKCILLESHREPSNSPIPNAFVEKEKDIKQKNIFPSFLPPYVMLGQTGEKDSNFSLPQIK